MSASEFRFLGPPTPEEEAKRVLTSLADGSYTPEELESTAIDLKEEAGRRHNGGIGPGSPHNERVALQLTEEVADLIRIGCNPPLIELIEDPSVQVILSGGRPDEDRYRLFGELQPRGASDDVDAALLIWRAWHPGTPFLTAASCAALLQRTRHDAENAIRRVAD